MTRADFFKLAIAGALSPLLSLLPEREIKPKIHVRPETASEILRREPRVGPNDYDCVFVFECGTKKFCRVGEMVEMPSRLIDKYRVTSFDKIHQEAYYWKDGELYVLPLPVQKEARND